MTTQQDQGPAPSRSTSLQLVRVEGWTPDSALLVGMGFRVQSFLCCLAGAVQLLTTSFCLARKTVSLVLWLRVEDFCWGFSCLCLLAFWVASFFSPICGTDEAKKKTRGNSPPCLSSGPEFCSVASLLSPLYLSESSYAVFYVMPRLGLYLE